MITTNCTSEAIQQDKIITFIGSTLTFVSFERKLKIIQFTAANNNCRNIPA